MLRGEFAAPRAGPGVAEAVGAGQPPRRLVPMLDVYPAAPASPRLQERPQHPLHVRRVEPSRRIALQQPSYDGKEGPGLGGRPYIVDDNRVHDATQRVATERRFTAQDRAQQHAHRPQVGLGAGADPGHPLGRGVLGRADERAALGERRGARDLGDAEVGEDDPAGAARGARSPV